MTKSNHSRTLPIVAAITARLSVVSGGAARFKAASAGIPGPPFRSFHSTIGLSGTFGNHKACTLTLVPGHEPFRNPEHRACGGPACASRPNVAIALCRLDLQAGVR